MNKKYSVCALFIFFAGISFICIPKTTYAKPRKINAIFDLGGVVLDASRLSFAYQSGFLRFAFGMLSVSPRKIHERFFNLLERIRPYNEDHSGTCDAQGKKLPQIMHDWMSKTNESAHEICTDALTQIDNGDHDSYFRGISEKIMLRAMIKTTFTPEIFIKTQKLHSDMCNFIRECKQEYDCNLYVISNYNKESFALLQRQYPDLFNQFDGIIISHEAGCMKPDNSIFKKLLNDFNLEAQDCIFIDDQPENCAAAQRCEIASILCEKTKKGPNVDAIRQQFYDFKKNHKNL